MITQDNKKVANLTTSAQISLNVSLTLPASQHQEIIELRSHRNSMHTKILCSLPDPFRAMYRILPSSGLLITRLQTIGLDPTSKNRAIRNAVTSHKLASRLEDTKAIKETEEVLNFLTSSSDMITAPTAALLTVLDPIGAIYSHYTQKKTLGGMNEFNQNFETERLYNEKSTFTKFFKAIGFTVGSAAWIIAPQWAVAASACALAFDVLLMSLNRKEISTQRFRSEQTPIY